MHGQRGPSCLLGECLTLSARWSGSWLLSLPPGTLPNCISQQEGWRAVSLLASPWAFPLEEYSSVATTPPYTSLSGIRGETQVSLHLNHGVSLGRRGSTSSPGCVKRKERPDSTGKAGGYKGKHSRWKSIPFLDPRDANLLRLPPSQRSFWRCGAVATRTLILKMKFKHVRNQNKARW